MRKDDIHTIILYQIDAYATRIYKETYVLLPFRERNDDVHNSNLLYENICTKCPFTFSGTE